MRKRPGVHWPGTTGHDIGMEFAQRTVQYAAPWAVTVVAAILAALAHWRWGGDPMTTPFVALLTAAIGAALVALVRKLTDKSGDRVRRDLYTVNVAALTLGVTVGLVAGMGHPAVVNLWLIGGFALCVANTIRIHAGKVVSETGERGGKWARVQEKLGLASYEVKDLTTSGRGTVKAKIEARDGATVDELQRKVPALTAAYGLGKGRMTMQEDPDDASTAHLRATPVDLLKHLPPWPGPSSVGASIGAGSILAGRYEDGEDVLISPTGDVSHPGNVEHLLVMGATGSGKSEWGRGTVTDSLTRYDSHVIVIDTSKGQQTFGAVRHGLTLFITEAHDARQLFKALPRTIKDRTDYLTSKGLKGWKPGCGLSFLTVWGEEAADYAADSAEYDRLCRTARSAGIWIVTSLQRATYTNISTDARANHGAGLCFGVRDAADAALVLPDEVIDAGVLPTWRAQRPGYGYMTGMGTPADRWTMVMRGYLTDDRVLADVVTQANRHREPLDPVTANALGAVYQNRTVYTTPLLEGDSSSDASTDGDSASRQHGSQSSSVAVATCDREPEPEPEPELDQPEYEELDMNAEDVRREVAELNTMLVEIAAMDPEPGTDYEGTGLDDDLPTLDPDTSLTFDRNGHDAITTDQAREELHGQLNIWIRDGRTTFTPKDLSHIWLKVDGDGRRWFYRERDRLIEADVIAESDEFGTYTLLRSPLDN